jgi:hypothetical protein
MTIKSGDGLGVQIQTKRAWWFWLAIRFGALFVMLRIVSPERVARIVAKRAIRYEVVKYSDDRSEIKPPEPAEKKARAGI